MYPDAAERGFNSKMLILDMDNTILDGRFIDTAAERLGFAGQLAAIRRQAADSVLRTEQIAALLAGVQAEEILTIAAGIPVIPDAGEVVSTFKHNGYITGIISDSYDCVTEYVRGLLGLDFALANSLELKNGVATGSVSIPEYFRKAGGDLCGHAICKSYALQHIAQNYDIAMTNVIAVGDSENDVCMIRYAGLGVAFCSRTGLLLEAADRRINIKSFRSLLEFAKLDVAR